MFENRLNRAEDEEDEEPEVAEAPEEEEEEEEEGPEVDSEPEVVADPASDIAEIEALGYTVMEGVDYIPGPDKLATVEVQLLLQYAIINLAPRFRCL